ncbi:MAG: cobalamin-binding protein [Candidatus Bathyarchaeia archaeon]
MNKKYAIAAIILIAIIISAAALLYYQGQLPPELVALQNLIDDTGYVTKMYSFPNRIISLAPSTTEIAFALGLDDKIVGVSDFCNYPYNFTAWIEAGNMTSIGAFDNPNMEVIASLDPDLILATAGVQGETVTTLRNLGYSVLVLNPANISGVLQNIELVGKATNKTAEAKALIDNITNRINAVVDKVAVSSIKPKVYYEVWYDPTSLWTAGAKAWQNELIEKAGGINLFADQDLEYFQSSAEAVISRNPDVIILPEEGMGKGELFWKSIDAVKERPGWNTVNAIKNNRICPIDSDTLSRAGPRVADAVEALAKAIHPELF